MAGCGRVSTALRGSRRLWLRGRHGVRVDHCDHRGPQCRRAPEKSLYLPCGWQALAHTTVFHLAACRLPAGPPAVHTMASASALHCPLLQQAHPAPRRLTLPNPAPRAGPFVTVIFADSLAGLFNAAPLLLATQPWYYASWRLVFTIIGFQARRPGPTRSGAVWTAMGMPASCTLLWLQHLCQSCRLGMVLR